MLAPHVVTRIRDTISAEASPRDRTLTQALRAAQNRLAARGMIGSGNAVIEFEKIAADELDVRTHIVWYAIRRAYQHLVGTPTDTMRTDLELQLNEHAHAQKRVVVDLTLGIVRIQPDQVGHFRQTLDARSREFREKAMIELQYFVDPATWTPRRDSAGGIVVRGNVGVIQTGMYAVANVSLSTEDRARMAEALERLRREIASSAEIGAAERESATEVVGDTLDALKAERPNTAKIAGLLGGIAITIQTVASLREAWSVVRDAAVAIGVLEP